MTFIDVMKKILFAFIFSGTVATYKWYHNKESQDIDLLAIWGVVIAKTLIGAGIVALAVSLVISVGFTSIIVGIGVGVAAAIVGGFIIEAGASYLGIDNKATQAVRSARDSAKEFINDTTDSLLGRDINLDKSLLR